MLCDPPRYLAVLWSITALHVLNKRGVHEAWYYAVQSHTSRGVHGACGLGVPHNSCFRDRVTDLRLTNVSQRRDRCVVYDRARALSLHDREDQATAAKDTVEVEIDLFLP